MSWMMRLSETYDNCISELWKGADTPGTPVLVGIGHTVKDFHGELCIDGQGNFIPNGGNRVLLSKEEQRTVIPWTEESASRTGNTIAPHPLFDDIRYLAGDLSKYKVNSNRIDNSGHHRAYMEFLNGWCASEYGFEKLRSIRDYLEKNTLTSDLIDSGILLCQDSEISINKDLKGLKDPAKLRVRLRVQISGDPVDSPWLDKAFWESYRGYVLMKLAQTSKDLCYASGEEEAPARLHPKVPMVSGESNTKLISSNDKKNYTFRGRFRRPEEAFCVGYKTSQKAYSALQWLKDKQSYRNSEEAFVIWGTRGETLPPTFADSQEVIEAAEEWSDDLGLERPSPNADTGEIEAKRVIKAMRGYGQRLADDSQIIVLGFGSAVPGRLAVTYYQELRGSDFLDCLKFWHGTCQWTHRYKWEKEKNSEDSSKKPKAQRRIFCGAPAPRDIGEAAYGARVKPKTLSRTAERLASSILNKTSLPADLVKELFYRACRPLGMGRDEYEKVITIACALIRKSYNDRCQREPLQAQTLESYEEVLKMSLEQEQTDRSYLFGRLLACGRRAEERVLYLNARRGEKEEGSESGASGLRATNAERLMTQFSIKPMKTWAALEKKLKYCWEFLSLRDPGAKHAIEAEINKIISSLGMAGAVDDRLSPLFIIGYRAQLEQFDKDRKEKYNSKLEKQIKEEEEHEIDG